MCFTQKTVFTICAHCTVDLVECHKFRNNPDKTGRHACIAPLCQHTQALAIILGFCKTCEAAYTGLDLSDLNATRILWNFWSFKAVQKWNYAVDPSRVPVSALASPAKMLCKSWFGYVRTYKEVSMDMIMALSVQSLVNALGEQVTAGSCDLCRAKHCQDVHRIAIGMREATISWTCSLEYSEEIFKSYGVHRALGHPCTEEANLATFENRPTEALASVPPSQQYHVPQISPSSPVSSEDFPMRVPKKKAGRQTKQLSAKLRMKIVLQEREAMFKELEAEHKRRVWELQAQANLDDAGISSGTSRPSAHNAAVTPLNILRCSANSHPRTPRTPSPQASPLSGPSRGQLFEGFSGAWEHKPFSHVQGNKDFELCELPCRSKTLQLHESSYAGLVGGVDELLFERRRARRSQYGDIVDTPEVSRGSLRVHRIEDELAQQDSAKGYDDPHCELLYSGEGDREEDANDEQIDFYLDDDSISVSERIRPLTYVSPQRSPNGCKPSTPQAPSPSSRRKLVALPAIPPVSPLHVTEFGFLAKPAEHFHRFSDRMDGQCDAASSDCPVKTAETTSESELGRDILGPASRMSSGSALRKGPEIRAFAPPRPARAPVFCITHGVEKQNGCQRCEVGAFREIGLKPGEHMDFPEPEPEQL